MKNVLKPLAKSVFKPSGSTGAASATDSTIQKKTFGSDMTTLTKSYKEKDDIIKIIKSLKDAGLLIKGVSETVEDEAKEQKRGFFSMLLGSLVASL